MQQTNEMGIRRKITKVLKSAAAATEIQCILVAFYAYIIENSFQISEESRRKQFLDQNRSIFLFCDKARL